MSFLRDTFVQFIITAVVTLVAGIIGAVTSFWIFLRQSVKKKISYQIITDAPIVNINEEFEKRIEITFNSEPIKDANLFILKIWNSGSIPIIYEDYFEAIRFEFQGRTVINGEIWKTEPGDFKIKPEETKEFFPKDKKAVELPKFPLNPNDTISFKLLVKGPKGKISPSGRIRDGHIELFDEVLQATKARTRVKVLSVLTLSILFILVSVGILAFSLTSLYEGNSIPVSQQQILNPTTVTHLAKKWTFQAGNSIYPCLSAVANNVIYVASDNGNLYAIDAVSGKQKWVFETPGTIGSSPIVVNGVVYAISSDGNLYAIDAVTGNKKWAFPTGNNSYSLPIVVNGIVFYVGSSNNGDYTLYAIDAVSGKQKWVFATTSLGITQASPTIVNGIVYAISSDDNLYAIDAVSGKQKWIFQTPSFSFINSWPTVINNVVYAISSDNNLYAIDAVSGKQKWTFRVTDLGFTVVNSIAYIGSSDHTLYAIDAVSGKQKWAFRMRNDSNFLPTVINSVVYIGSSDHNLYAIDAVSGKQKWVFRIDTKSTPMVANNVVYVISSESNLYAIDAVSGKQKWAFDTNYNDQSQVSVFNGVVFYADANNLNAIDAASGHNLWTFDTDYNDQSQLTIVNSVVYFIPTQAQDILYAFALSGS